MPIDDSGFHFFENTSSKRICFFPISIYFPTNPSLEECAKVLLQDNVMKRNSFVFIPLTSDSQPIHQQVDRCHSLSYEFDLWQRSSNLLTLQLRNLCHLSDSMGFLLTVSNFFRLGICNNFDCSFILFSLLFIEILQNSNLHNGACINSIILRIRYSPSCLILVMPIQSSHVRHCLIFHFTSTNLPCSYF